MRTLDRYVVRHFVVTALLFFVGVLALRIVIDLFINMDEFAKQDKPLGQLVSEIVTYYGYHSLVYFMELGGVIVVASAAFTLAMMNHTNELTAMLASGVSLKRVVVPIILCALLLCGLITLDQELLIPRVASQLVRDRSDVPGTESFPVRLPVDQRNAAWFSSEFRPAANRMDKPLIILRDEQYRYAGRIVGGEGCPGGFDGRDGWLLPEGTLVADWRQAAPTTTAIPCAVSPHTIIEHARQVYQRRHGEPIEASEVQTLAPLDLEAPHDGYLLRITADRFVAGDLEAGRAVGGELQNACFTFRTKDGRTLGTFIADSARWVNINPIEAQWQLTGGKLFCESDLTADDLVLRQSSRWLDYMSMADLNKLLQMKRLQDPPAAVLAKQVRITDPINNLLMLLLGLPFILSRERNIKASAGLCLLTVATFYAFVFICRYMGLPPVWAAWLPILLFGPIAVVMFDSVKT